MGKLAGLASVLLLGTSISAYAAPMRHATVVLLRGIAKTQSGKPLHLQDPIPPGTAVTTGARSFVKLLFADKTQLNIGPETTMKIEPVRSGEPSLVSLVGGQIRAKVTKDLLHKEDGKPKEKLLIQTKTAAMGIRGTDFSVSYNRANDNTALLTFEGNVAMVRREPNQPPAAALDRNEVQSVLAGQFSGTQPQLPKPTVPIRISPAQLETLKQNETMAPVNVSTAKKAALASPIPPGVDPKRFASGAEKSVRAAMEKAAGSNAIQAAAQRNQPGPDVKAPPPEGYFDAKTGTYAPRAGGFVDLHTGQYVPPPPGSSFDPNTGVYVPPRAVGGFDPNSGNYVPPAGIKLDAVKGFVADIKPVAVQPGAPPPPPPQMQAMMQALNSTMNPENAGAEVSFDKTFVPNANGEFMPPPPPPPDGDKFLDGSQLPPPPDEPVDDPFCPTCIDDNVNQPPDSTAIHFQITVQ